MKTEIYVWSAIGNTPVTHRGGSFCDELYHGFIEAENPEDANAKAVELVRSTPHGDKGYFNMPEWPNQNTRSNWVGREVVGLAYSVLSA